MIRQNYIPIMGVQDQHMVLGKLTYINTVILILSRMIDIILQLNTQDFLRIKMTRGIMDYLVLIIFYGDHPLLGPMGRKI